jgi:phage protein D/phage baseplate assembly protein gpV
MIGQQQQQHTTKWVVEFDGRPMSADVEPLLVSAFVDDNRTMPDMFVLCFRDPKRTVLESLGAKVGSKVKIGAVSDASPAGEPLVQGEVTALELDYDQRDTLTVVRGFDNSHRLFRGINTFAYRNVTYSDVVRTVAQRAGVQVGAVDSTSGVYPHVTQAAENDWAFLRSLAREVGYELVVEEGKLCFKSPIKSTGAPGATGLETKNPLQLVYGSNLLRLRATITSAEQVQNVEVRGWDVMKKQPVVGTAPADTHSATLQTKPAQLAGMFGGKTYVRTEGAYQNQAEVDAVAKVTAEQVSGTFAELDGVARGNPKLKAGAAVSLSLLGEPFDGKYVLSSARHTYDPKSGYTTAFTVSGQQDRSLLSLTSSNGNNGSGEPVHRSPGVAVALVTDVADPDKLGRVKLKFPWLSEDFQSDWVRTVQAGAGANRGTVILPEVNDEVLVAFEQGQARRPYVIGGLYNGVDKPKLGDGELVNATNGQIHRRGFTSRVGHTLIFDDEKNSVTIKTGKGELQIVLDEQGKTMKLVSKGKVEISADQDITVKGGANVSVEATAKLTLKGATVEVTGQPIKLN